MQHSPRSSHRSRAAKKLHHAVSIESLEPRRLLSATVPANGALIVTSLGSMFVQLDSDTAPNTVNNFLGYVNSGAYNGTIIHRITTVATDGISVIQGGGFKVATDSTGTQSLKPLGNFIGGTNDTLTFGAGAGATITRTEGSFIADAFAPGQTLTITGTTTNDTTVTIATVTASVITVSNTSTLAAQTITDSTDVGISTTLPTIADENPGGANVLGTIAMAKTSAADSASTEWFINTADNTNALSLQNQTNGGFTIFGQVIYGLNVAVDIDNLRSFDASTSLNSGAATELPITDRNQFVDVISATQEQFMTATIGQGQAENSILFTDSDGTRVTLVITHGTASINLTGTGLSSSSAGGVITIGGSVNELEDITTSNTSLATTLTATAAGGNLHATVQNVNTTGALGSMQLNPLDVVGTYTTVGALSWTGPSNTQGHTEDIVPATLTVSGAKTLSYQFNIPAQITQKAGHSFVKGSNTDGSNPLSTETIFNIDATGTTTASILKVTTPHAQFVSIGGFSTNGSMDGVDARRTMNLTGPLVVAGTMRRVNLIGMSDANIVVQGTTKGKTLIVDSPDNFDSNVFSSIPIKSILVAGSWISSSSTTTGAPSSTVSAPSLGNMIVLGTFGVNLQLSDAKANVKSMIINVLDASTWTIAGGIGKWSANTVNAGFNATISGSVQSLKSSLIKSGDTEDTHTNITVSGNLNDVFVTESQSGFVGTVTGNIKSLKTVTFAGAWTVGSVSDVHFKTVNAGVVRSNAALNAKTPAIGHVVIDGTADNISIIALGNIGSITADAFTDRSTIMDGILDVGSNLNTLVNTPQQYQTHATIGSVTVHRSSSPSYINTLIDAWHIGKLNLGTIVLENVGIPFGLAADSIDFISARGNNGQNLSFTHKIDDPAALQQEILQRGLSTVDFQIVLV